MYRDMKLPIHIQALLRCPTCTGKLNTFGSVIVCTNSMCGTVYPIVNGVPVLINENASVFSRDDFSHQRSTFFDLSKRGERVRELQNLLPSLQRDEVNQPFYQEFSSLLLESSSEPKVLVVGGSIIGKGMQPILQNSPPIQLIESDISFGPRTVLIADAHDIPFEDAVFDGVIAQAVLEHVLDPVRCVSEIHRVLKRDGLVYVQTPFMQQVHGAPYDFNRWTHLGHRRLWRQFEEIDSGTVNGPGTALAWAYQYFLLSFVTSPQLRALVRAFTQITSFYLKYFDYILDNKPGALDAASGYFFIGRRSDKSLADKELIELYKGGLLH
jgi:SAM-dependent methyltransferase